ncbi:MAG: hypothetical protein HYY17_04750 [Planctomycetes bacterium]|nr:hypothetical protein [Planctomycetota bacterium]
MAQEPLIVSAPTAFKETLPPRAAARSIARGALCGSLSERAPGAIELAALAGSVERAMRRPARWLARAAEIAARELKRPAAESQ